jgi:hypothetical protein
MLYTIHRLQAQISKKLSTRSFFTSCTDTLKWVARLLFVLSLVAEREIVFVLLTLEFDFFSAKIKKRTNNMVHIQ